MKKLIQPVWSYLRELGRAAIRGWPRFWFTPADPTPLAMIRFLIGLVVFYTHLATITDFMDFVGPNAWVDMQAIAEMRDKENWRNHPAAYAPEEADRLASFDYYAQSIWMYVQNPTAIWILHGLFMVSTLCFTLGLFSRTTSVIVWAGHLSYIHRARALWYGMDTMLAFLLLYMMFAPSGQTLSLDRWLARRRQLKRAEQAGARIIPPEEPVQPSVAANLVTRLIQVHLCIVYLCSGLAKLQGNMWWNGSAVYMSIMDTTFSPIDMSWMVRVFPLNVLLFISSVGVLLTLFYEIGFTFLVWIPRWKPIMLFLGLLMHIGISISMGLGSFQAAMMIALIAFVKPESCRWFVDTLLGREGTPAATAAHVGENGPDRPRRTLAGANRLS